MIQLSDNRFVFALCSQYEAEVTFGDSNEAVFLLVDPGSSLVAVAEDKYTVSPGAIKLREGDEACDVINDPLDPYGRVSNSTECAVYSSYQDGSSLSGYAVRDSIIFDQAKPPAGGDVVLGVITDISNPPNQVNNNGIIGVDRGKISMVSQLYDSGDVNQFAFGQCGTSPKMNGSFGVLGSYLPSASYDSIKLYTGSEISTLSGFGEPFEKAVININDGSASYYVLFSGVEINGKRIKNATYSTLPTSFDTGTPTIILPSEYFDAIAASINATVSGLSGKYEFVKENLPFVGDVILVAPMSGILDDSVIGDIFPNITLLFGDDPVEIVIPPEAYVMSADFEGVAGFSVKFSSLGTSESLDEAAGVILGTPIVYDRFVQVNSDTSAMMISKITPGCAFEQGYPEPEMTSPGVNASTSGSNTPLVLIIQIFSSLIAGIWM